MNHAEMVTYLIASVFVCWMAYALGPRKPRRR